MEKRSAETSFIVRCSNSQLDAIKRTARITGHGSVQALSLSTLLAKAERVNAPAGVHAASCDCPGCWPEDQVEKPVKT